MATSGSPVSSTGAESQTGVVVQATGSERSVSTPLASGGGFSGVVQRSELHQDTTEVANVTGVDALREKADPASTSLGNLAVNDTVRILEKPAGAHRVHVETGALQGKIGFFNPANLNINAKPTAQWAAAYGWNMYLYCRTKALANDRGEVIGSFHLMTPDQHQTLLTPGDATWTAIKSAAAITADDLINMLNVCGAPLNRKLTDYLDKGGKIYDKVRLAFATSTDAERRTVAGDDALVGRVAPLLPKIHPEILFGPVVAELYPASGKIEDLVASNPNLGAWLKKFTGKNQNIKEAAQKRATGLAGALQEMKTNPGVKSYKAMMVAVHAAPRGMALPAAESTALDEIEALVYPMSSCSANDMAVMFVTRWGRDIKEGYKLPKTFTHQIWVALKQLPSPHVMLNNVANYFIKETDPKNLGSFGFWMFNKPEHGSVKSVTPTDTGVLHCAAAKTGKNHLVKEQKVDILKTGDSVEVTDANNNPQTTKVAWVNTSSRHIGLKKTVKVKEDSEIKQASWTWEENSTAYRVSKKLDFYKEKAADSTPDLANKWGDLLVGNLYTRDDWVENVGGKNYRHIYVHEGQFRKEYGWILDDPASQSALGDTSMAQENFAWTVRHEMGHSMDLQVGGFTTFSAACPAQWIHYPGASEWLDKVLPAGGLNHAAATANHTYGPVGSQVTDTFRNAAQTYANAVQAGKSKDAPAMNAKKWFDGYLAANPGAANLVNTVTQYFGNSAYYNLMLPALGGKVYTVHYGEWFHFSEPARTGSLAAGVPPYAYTCPKEFFAEHYAAYTGPGIPPEKYARAVPEWAKNYFDRLVGRPGAGPALGPKA